jgi:molecular chaperone DnaK (HSP70)
MRPSQFREDVVNCSGSSFSHLSGLSEAEIDRMVWEAEKHAAENARRRQEAELLNRADNAFRAISSSNLTTKYKLFIRRWSVTMSPQNVAR